jgi:hypothetical protein
MEYITIVITLVIIASLGYSFYRGYRLGVTHGMISGRAKAVRDLLLVKDPEAWDKARYLEIEEQLNQQK